MFSDEILAGAVWKKAARSLPKGNNCAQFAELPGDVLALQDSQSPGAGRSGTLFFKPEDRAAAAALFAPSRDIALTPVL